MAFTRHGHHIPSTPMDHSDMPKMVARCGGPGLCYECQEDMVRWHVDQNKAGYSEKVVEINRSEHHLLTYFDYAHLHPDLQKISAPFGRMAKSLDETLEPGSQKDLALTHLLQAKDAAVRSYLTTLNKKDTNR